MHSHLDSERHTDVSLPAFDRVLIARHGETEWNTVGRRQGQLDSPLTGAGVAHAEAMAAQLAAHPIDSMFVSPSGRTQATADVIATAVPVPRYTLDELAEIHHGDFAGLTVDEVEEAFPGTKATRAAKKYEWPFPGGESYADVALRAVAGLNAIAEHGSRRPLLVTHSGTAKLLLKALLDLDSADALSRTFPFGEIVVIDAPEWRTSIAQRRTR